VTRDKIQTISEDDGIILPRTNKSKFNEFQPLFHIDYPCFLERMSDFCLISFSIPESEDNRVISAVIIEARLTKRVL